MDKLGAFMSGAMKGVAVTLAIFVTLLVLAELAFGQETVFVRPDTTTGDVASSLHPAAIRKLYELAEDDSDKVMRLIWARAEYVSKCVEGRYGQEHARYEAILERIPRDKPAERALLLVKQDMLPWTLGEGCAIEWWEAQGVKPPR